MSGNNTDLIIRDLIFIICIILFFFLVRELYTWFIKSNQILRKISQQEIYLLKIQDLLSKC